MRQLIACFIVAIFVFGGCFWAYAEDDDDGINFDEVREIKISLPSFPNFTFIESEQFGYQNFKGNNFSQQQNKTKFELMPHPSFVLSGGFIHIDQINKDEPKWVETEELRPFFNFAVLYKSDSVVFKQKPEMSYRIRETDEEIWRFKDTFLLELPVLSFAYFYPYLNNQFRYEFKTEKINNQTKIGIKTLETMDISFNVAYILQFSSSGGDSSYLHIFAFQIEKEF
ncbi:MAG: hypothetical protein Q8O83_02385 [bacterium]|nr:hypothetical protein [bacterium]